jgi:glyoxylate reductase
MGRIGKAVAKRARAFGLQVIDRKRSSDAPLVDFLGRCDFVSLHCPLSPETHHLIGRAELQAMKPTAVLINTARGPVVDEQALVQALESGWIAAAGLDVFEQEPRVHPGLLGLANVVLLPHLGSATRKSRLSMARLAAQGAISVLFGQEPAHRVV